MYFGRCDAVMNSQDAEDGKCMKASAKGRPVGVRENVQSLRTEKLADVREDVRPGVF